MSSHSDDEHDVACSITQSPQVLRNMCRSATLRHCALRGASLVSLHELGGLHELGSSLPQALACRCTPSALVSRAAASSSSRAAHRTVVRTDVCVGCACAAAGLAMPTSSATPTSPCAARRVTRTCTHHRQPLSQLSRSALLPLRRCIPPGSRRSRPEPSIGIPIVAQGSWAPTVLL